MALLHKNANHANVLAQQAQAQQQQQQANAQAEQQAQNDIATLLQDASLSGFNLSGDLANFQSDVQSSKSDLKTAQQDAGQSKGYCNASLMVNGDTEDLDGDMRASA